MWEMACRMSVMSARPLSNSLSARQDAAEARCCGTTETSRSERQRRWHA